ncbi:hypothetical protein [Palleronia caenipelagi]|uniref:Tetratricopeptide repeat protein n=1 Tax=Palleronia caenipelagi TaxID=2489174 RepID=A0A547PLF4_9RHOB|nr:hypothetical protein [Palleronia caenipelagi]TRD14946.1 hypothetical protein FEV53_18015 [Palleronia caenipelagi]
MGIKKLRDRAIHRTRAVLARKIYGLKSGREAALALFLARNGLKLRSSTLLAATQVHVLYSLNRLEELSITCWDIALGPKKYRSSQLVMHMLLKSAWLLKDEALLTLMLQQLESTTMASNNLSFIGLRKGAHPGFAALASLKSYQAQADIMIGVAGSTSKSKKEANVLTLDLLEIHDPGKTILDQINKVEETATVLRYRARVAVQQERWPDAWDLFEAALAQAPLDQRTYAEMGEVALYLDDPLKRTTTLLDQRTATNVPTSGYDRLLGQRYMLEADDIAYLKLRGAQISNKVARSVYGHRVSCSMGQDAKPFSALIKRGFVIGRDGVSDEIRWSAFYPKIRKYFENLEISCDPRLTSLFRRSYPDITFFPVTRNWGRAQVSNHEIKRNEIPHIELANRLDNKSFLASLHADEVMFIEDVAVRSWQTQPNSLPEKAETAPFLVPQPDRANYWQEELRRRMRDPQRIRVGLIWRSSLIDAARARHYMQLDDFAPLFGLDAEFFSIQHHVNGDERRTGLRMGVHFLDEEVDFYDDFDEIAAVTSALDLVIGVSTLPYEMAAAVGVPCLLCAISPQGRWMRLGAEGNRRDRLTRNGQVFFPKQPVDYLSPRQKRVESIISQIGAYVERMAADR